MFISDDPIAQTTLKITDPIDISKFHFAHLIRVPHGTNLLASDSHSSTICINSVGNIIHVITPTGYHIHSARWPETEDKIIDLQWCDVLRVYLVLTQKCLYSLEYDSSESLLINKLLELPHHYMSPKYFISYNSYRVYLYDQSSKLVHVYTFKFVHLHTKQLPNSLGNRQIEAFSCSDSFLALLYQDISKKVVLVDPVTMATEHEFILPYKTISSVRCWNDEDILIFTGVRHDEESRLILLKFGTKRHNNEVQESIVEKSIENGEQFVYLLPNCHDLMILNVDAARVQHLKYRS